MAKCEDDLPEMPTQEELDSIPFPGCAVRHYTSADRRSFMDGTVTDFIDNPAGDMSQEAELRVWFTSRVVRGGEPKEFSVKRWLPMSALEVLPDDEGEEGETEA